MNTQMFYATHETAQYEAIAADLLTVFTQQIISSFPQILPYFNNRHFFINFSLFICLIATVSGDQILY